MKNQEIKLTNTSQLIPYARNARTHSESQVDQIAASIREFGFNNPILIKDDLTVIAGHGRLMAAKKLGLEQVPTLCLSHLSSTQVKAYILADNKLAMNAGWDDEMLATELEELTLEGFDTSLIGFDENEIANLLSDLNEGERDEDDVPVDNTEPVSRPGDVWILGKHRVMCGDATDAALIAKLLKNELADMWLTDPPYNVNYVGGTEDQLTIKNDSKNDEDFRSFLTQAYLAAKENMKDGAVFYIWYADIEGYNFYGAAKDSGLQVRQSLVWKKSSLVMGRKDYHWIHEPCLYGWKDGASHLWASDRKQTSVFEFDKPHRNGEHPTMKPVALFEYVMLNNTHVNSIVLDTFGGSGTTLIAAHKNNRVSRLMELDPKYCDVIVKRWQDFSGDKAMLESNGKSFDDLNPNANNPIPKTPLPKEKS
jgi:site-specific DNA-methyltransferase (adenine-specific)